MWLKGDDSAVELIRLQLSARESPVQFDDVPLLPRSSWIALTDDMVSSARNGASGPRDMRALLWLRGAASYAEEQMLSGLPGFSLVHEAMSVGIRSGAFPAVCDACDLLLTGESSPSLDKRLDLYFKYVRLLKRRGRFTEALQLLGAASVELAATNEISDRRLWEARILLSAAKALGSHQSRLEQSCVLARLALRRAEGMMAQFPDARDVQNTWLRSVDAASNLSFELRSRTGNTEGLAVTSSLFKQWRRAAELDEALGNRPSRVAFARLNALDLVARNARERSKYRKQFFSALKKLSAGPIDRRGLAVRHAQYARIALRAGLFEEASRHADIALNCAELVCDWQSISRTLLLKAEVLVASKKFDQSLVQSLLSRGKRTLEKLEEPPLELLLSYSQDQARQYLLIGETAEAIRAIEEALADISKLRKALQQEQYLLRHSVAKSRAPVPAPWHRELQVLLSERERIRLNTSLGGDWELLSHSQEMLIDKLKTANQISTRHSNCVHSARRASYLRRAIYHTMENVVGKAFDGLYKSVDQEGQNATDRVQILNAIHAARKNLLALTGAALRDESTTEETVDAWQDIAQLVNPPPEYLETLRFFDPDIQVRLNVASSFEVQAERESFQEHFFNFLMNAAQQTATMPGDPPHVIDISVRWDTVSLTGIIEVTDPVGRLQQLTEGLGAAYSKTRNPDGRRRGLNYVLSFFDEMWKCRVHATGVEGIRSTAVIGFRVGARVRSL